MSDAARIFEIDPAHYRPHALHGFERDFRESNCYVDVFIGVLHALGLEPTAALACTLASDFEGDQWTFFKPGHADLEQLYGVRVEELTLWRPLLDHVCAQLARRRLPLVEVDAFFLPDTADSDYRKNHVKTSIAIAHADPRARRLRYFHNAGYHELHGEDFDGLLRTGATPGSERLPPYCELIKLDRVQRSDPDELRAISRELARRYLALRPAQNPLRAHAAHLREHLQWIAEGGPAVYHAYSFAAMRQLGASFELASSYLRFLGGDCVAAAEPFERIGKTAKMLILKLARVASTGRAPDLETSFEQMAHAWDAGMEALARLLGERT